jgi:hypothetical protein
VTFEPRSEEYTGGHHLGLRGTGPHTKYRETITSDYAFTKFTLVTMRKMDRTEGKDE